MTEYKSAAYNKITNKKNVCLFEENSTLQKPTLPRKWSQSLVTTNMQHQAKIAN